MVSLERTRSPMTNLASVLKSRRQLADKLKQFPCQSDGFSSRRVQVWEVDRKEPVVMYRCERWTVKKAEHQRIDAFELCWRRLLRVCWTARRSNQSTLKEMNSEYSLEELMLKLKLQYFGHLMQRSELLEKTLVLRKIEGKRRGQHRMRWLDSIIHWL